MTGAGPRARLALLALPMLLAACDRIPGAGSRPAAGRARGAATRAVTAPVDTAAARELAAPHDRAGADPGARAAPRRPAVEELAGAVLGDRYIPGPVPDGAVVEGRLVGGRVRDVSVTPTHDQGACAPFTESLVPTRDGGVGPAVVWLAGVRTGPPDTTTRRARLELDGCRLAPRVQRVRQGSTLLVASYDAMSSRLRFTAEAAPTETLAEVSFTDAGQVVPVEGVTRAPGLVRVRDARHPWVMGVLAVAPHPWVAVTEADGRFRFEGVPPGRYTLVAWQEALGTRTQPLRVDPGITVRLTVRY